MAGEYEDLEPDKVIEHAIRRTVTEADNMLFSALTYDCAPLHIDAEYSRTSIYGRPADQQHVPSGAAGGHHGGRDHPGVRSSASARVWA